MQRRLTFVARWVFGQPAAGHYALLLEFSLLKSAALLQLAVLVPRDPESVHLAVEPGAGGGNFAIGVVCHSLSVLLLRVEIAAIMAAVGQQKVGTSN